MKSFFEVIKTSVEQNPPDLGDSNSVLSLLYEVYAEYNKMDDNAIKEDFNSLYRLMNGMTLTQMDAILDPVCRLCWDHERSGFIHGI